MIDRHYKVIMIGDSGVGKTALVNRLSCNTFVSAHAPTVGGQFAAIPLDLGDRQLTVELWDTAGQEMYRSIVAFYAREAMGAFLVFDVTNADSFEGVPQWIDFANDNAPGVKLVLFANKTDLAEQRVISFDDILEFAHEHKLEFFEGSAYLNEHVQDAMRKMGELLADPDVIPPNVVELDTRKEPRKGKCC
jgi:small GTP-binding protein